MFDEVLKENWKEDQLLRLLFRSFGRRVENAIGKCECDAEISATWAARSTKSGEQQHGSKMTEEETLLDHSRLVTRSG